VFSVCEDRDVYAFLLSESDQFFQNGGYICNQQNGVEWPGHPYSKLTEYGVTTPLDMFTNSNVFDIYKKRLFYIQARYGYSPNLCAYEVCNEINTIGKGYSYDYDNTQSTRTSVYNWAVDVADYYKSLEPVHMTTISYADVSHQNPSLSYNPTSSSSFDIRSPHHYGHDRDVPYTRFNRIQNQLYGTSSNPVTPDAVRKPVIFGEMGLTDDTEGDKCTDVEFHKGMWLSGVAGCFGAGLYRYDYENNKKRQDHIPALSVFFDNMPFETDDFTPNYFHDNSGPRDVEAFYNVNNTGSKGFGWLQNYKYYWATDPNIDPICINDDHNTSISPGGAGSYNEEFKLSGFQGGKNFIIELWHCYGSGGVYNSFHKTATLTGGNLKFSEALTSYPSDQSSYPDYGVKIYKDDQQFKITNANTNPYYNMDKGDIWLENDTLIQDDYTIKIQGRFEPTISYHHWDFGNGQFSTEQYPTIDYQSVGTYSIIYSTLNSNNDTVRYHQTVVLNNVILKNEQEKTSTNIYIAPNPSVSIFSINIVANIELQYYCIYDSKGSLIICNEGTEKLFDLKDYNNGLYSVVMYTNTGITTKKIVKQD